ncbi:MAG: helix-turn-helix transcriptional regulator [Pseudonocardiales bacterium]
MSPAPQAEFRLASRLRDLRESAGMRQRELARVIGVSVASISSYESRTAPKPPTEDRIRAYARVFGPRVDGEPEAASSSAISTLTAELTELRQLALRPAETVPDVGALGGRFWYFSHDGQPITIISSPMPLERLEGIDYARPTHPNAIASLANADIDSVVELFGHIRAENPRADVHFTTADRVDADDLTGHVVVLGPSGPPQARLTNTRTGWFTERMNLPVRVGLPPGGDPEFDGWFEVSVDANGVPEYGGHRVETHQPQWQEEVDAEGTTQRAFVDGLPQLVYDLALIARRPNPLNSSAKITVCFGVFTRGTYGAVRAFTDVALRQANEAYVRERFTDQDDFWMVIRVPVYSELTVTANLARPYSRIVEWPPPEGPGRPSGPAQS